MKAPSFNLIIITRFFRFGNTLPYKITIYGKSIFEQEMIVMTETRRKLTSFLLATTIIFGGSTI